MKEYRTAYQTIMHMSTAEITGKGMTEPVIDALLSEATRIAENRRANAMAYMRRAGIDTTIYSEESPYSYKDVDFNVPQDAKLSTKQAKLAEIRRFLGDYTSTATGIRKQFTDFKNTLASTYVGNDPYEAVQQLERLKEKNGWSIARFRRERSALLEEMGAEARKIMTEEDKEALKMLESKESVKTFWQVYRHIRETHNRAVYGSDSVKEIIAQEISYSNNDTVDSIVDRVRQRLSEAYRETNSEGHDTFENFRGYRNGGN